MAKLFMKRVTVFNNETDEEYDIELPHTREVCEGCDGHGTRMNRAMAEHAYTAEEFNESFDDEEREEYCRRGGMYDVVCWECDGAKVVDVLSREDCKTSEEKEALRFIDEAEESAYQTRMIEANERRMGC